LVDASLLLTHDLGDDQDATTQKINTKLRTEMENNKKQLLTDDVRDLRWVQRNAPLGPKEADEEEAANPSEVEEKAAEQPTPQVVNGSESIIVQREDGASPMYIAFYATGAIVAVAAAIALFTYKKQAKRRKEEDKRFERALNGEKPSSQDVGSPSEKRGSVLVSTPKSKRASARSPANSRVSPVSGASPTSKSLSSKPKYPATKEKLPPKSSKSPKKSSSSYSLMPEPNNVQPQGIMPLDQIQDDEDYEYDIGSDAASISHQSTRSIAERTVDTSLSTAASSGAVKKSASVASFPPPAPSLEDVNSFMELASDTASVSAASVASSSLVGAGIPHMFVSPPRSQRQRAMIDTAGDGMSYTVGSVSVTECDDSDTECGVSEQDHDDVSVSASLSHWVM
jgi:hypothetical protein